MRLKVKYLILLTLLLPVLLLLLKVKYLVSVISSKNLTMAQKLMKLEKKNTDHNYDIYITTPKVWGRNF